MSTLTIRLPADKHNRLKILAKQRGISMNKLMEELSTMALSEFDAFTRFQVRAMKGSPQEGLQLLDKLDQQNETR
ncbi:MAG: toxin-antitoxin system HicB family antitoxin [Deltaproteobacteria bacterium]|nr:toxin-antitoxin system HicB family antitoxin [Deltaproteobacteria bacterium]